MPRITPKIPQGLEELMLNLAKSVIKENPQNLYEFAADYFEKLLKERDGKVDDSYKKLPAYKAYKRAKLEKNRLEVEGIKVELEARRRIGSAQTSRSFNRSSSATKNVEKLPKIASSSAETESVLVEAESSKKSAKKLPNISGTAAKVAVGTVAVGVAAGAVKPALMAVKPQRKSEEIVDYNEGIESVDGNLENLTQSAADDGVDHAGTEGILAESEGDLEASRDAQTEDEVRNEDTAENLESSELITDDFDTKSAQNSEINPQHLTENSKKLENMPENAQNLDEILEIEPQSSLKAALNSENHSLEPTEALQNSENLTFEPEISSDHSSLQVTTQPTNYNPSDDIIECSTVDVNFLNQKSSENDDIVAENSNEIMENMIDSNERKVDGNVSDKMNEISEIAGNKNNDDGNIGMTDKSGGNEVDLAEETSGVAEENVENSARQKAEPENEGNLENPEDTKLTKIHSINSASSAENDYHSSNPSIKSSEFSNLSGESVKYQVLNVSSDTQESQSFDDNYAGNIEAETEILHKSSLEIKQIDANDENLTKSDKEVEEPSEFGSELVDKIRYFEENSEILEDSEETIEDMETKFEKFGEIMRKIEESDERTEEDFVKLSQEVENESKNLKEVGDELENVLEIDESKLDNETHVNVKEQDFVPELAHLETQKDNLASKSVNKAQIVTEIEESLVKIEGKEAQNSENLEENKENLEEIEENLTKSAEDLTENSGKLENLEENKENLTKNTEKLAENSGILTENSGKLIENSGKLENLEVNLESSGKNDKNTKIPFNENQIDSKLNPEDKSDQYADIFNNEAIKLENNDGKIDKSDKNVINSDNVQATDEQDQKNDNKNLESTKETLESSEYDLDAFNPEDTNEASNSPVKNHHEVQQSINESSKIFEQEVINIENILDTFEKLSPEVTDFTLIGDDDFDKLVPKKLNSAKLRDFKDTNDRNLGSGIEISENKATSNLETEPTIESQVISTQNDPKSPKMSPKNSKIQNDQEISKSPPKTHQNSSINHQEPAPPTTPDYYQEIDSKATTAEMKDNDFIFKSPDSTDISKIIEQKFTVDNKSTKNSVQGNESETSVQNDIELSQKNGNEAATGSDNCEKEIKADEFANEEEIGVENGNFCGVDNLMVEEEGSDKDKAAVKIQSLFRGYQVRKSGKIEKFEEKLDEIVNNKFVPKVQEPSEFGTELVSKIQEFEENVEDLEGSEDVVEDMEVKFEKFGEIMRKIEESGENDEENEDVKVGSAENSAENGNNLEAVEESAPKSSENYLNVRQGPVKSASYKEIVQAITVDAEDIVPKESSANNQNFEEPPSTVDGNVTETSKDEDFIDILLDESAQNNSELQNEQEFDHKSTRTKRSISPETGEDLTAVTLRIDPEDTWAEDFDALKVTKTHQIRPKSAMRTLQHQQESQSCQDIKSYPNLLATDPENSQNFETSDKIATKIQEGIDEVDLNFDGQEDNSPTDTLHPSYPDDMKVTNKDINETILDNSEQINDGINDKLIEAQTKTKNKSEMEENKEAEINEMVSKSERPTENADNVDDFSLNGLKSDGKVDTSVIKAEEELKKNLDKLGSLENGNVLNIEDSDVIKQLNEENLDESFNIVAKDALNLSVDATNAHNDREVENDNLTSIYEQSSKQPEDSSSSNSSNDSSGFNYEVLPSPPTDSPGNSENEANFDEIVRNLTPNLKENAEIEESFERIVDDLQENPEASAQESTELPDNPTKSTKIFDKYLDIYDENLENFEYFTNNPDGTLKKSHKIVEKLNEIVDDEVAKYVEKLESENEADSKTEGVEPLAEAQFDVFEYAVPNDEVEEAAKDDNKLPEKLIDLPLVFRKGDDKKSEVEPENMEISSPEPEIIEEIITKVEVKPQLSENIPIPHPHHQHIPEPPSKLEAKPSKSPDEKENAAVKIQSFFRGFKVRKSSKPKRKSVKKSKEPSVFGNELVDKIQEFEEQSEVKEDAEEVVEDMETKFEKFGEIMKKIEESDEKIGEMDVKINIQEDIKEDSSPVSNTSDQKPQKSKKNGQNLANSAEYSTLKPTNQIESTTSIPTEPNKPQETIPASQILNPLQGFEKLTQKFEENSADQAAVKIQSLFRGFKVRKSHPPRKYKQNVKEPSAFGSELVDKIEEFEDKEVKNENLEEVVEDMEVKFEKFGEIMRKIEESEENVVAQDGSLEIQEKNLKEIAEKSIDLDAEIVKELERENKILGSTKESFEVNEANSVQKHVNFIESKLEKESIDNNSGENSHKTIKIDTKSSKMEPNPSKLDTKPPKINENSCQPASSKDKSSIPTESASNPSNDTEKDNAAVKIQSFFRGFKVRKSNSTKKTKIQEPSTFGSELVDKIEEFEENKENLENTEEITAKMEEKFEKFGKILKKIEESEKTEELDETGCIEGVSNDQLKVLSPNNQNNASILKENGEKSNKFDASEEKNSKMPENSQNSANIQQDSTDNKPKTASPSKPTSTNPKNSPKQSTDDETNAAVKIQSFFRGFKVRKSHKPKVKESSAFGAELIDKIEESEAKNEGSDEYVEDMEAEFEKFGDIMKKIEESEEKLEVLEDNLIGYEKVEAESAVKAAKSEKQAGKLANFEIKSENFQENQQNFPKSNENSDKNPQNHQPTPTAPSLTPEDLLKNDPQQPINQTSGEDYEEDDQLATIYELNSVEEEPCTEKFISRCGPNLEQNDDEKIICGQEENESKLVSEELTSNLESNAAENAKFSKNQPLVKLEDPIEAEMQKMSENLDQKAQKFVKIGDKFVIVEENPKEVDETPKTDNEVLENLAKSTEKLSKFSEKMSKSPAKNSNFEVTSENFEEISKQFDQISKEYDKLYKKIEEKFEENVQVLRENSVILDDDGKFGEKSDGKSKKIEEKFENSVKNEEKLENSVKNEETSENSVKNEENLTKFDQKPNKNQQNDQISQQIDSKRNLEASHPDEEASTEQAKAAVKIQSTFRGYKVRKSRFQKFKDNLSEKFNQKTEPKIEEPSTFGSELIEKIKDFGENGENTGENEENSEEIVENMEEKFEKFGEIMRKIEESDEKLEELDENLNIQEKNLENFVENQDDFDMDSLEYEAGNQNSGTNSNLTQNLEGNLTKLQEVRQEPDSTAKPPQKIAENDQIFENIPNFSDQPQPKIALKSSKIPIKQKLSKSESLQDLVPTDSKSINKLSHSTDHTPLLSPNSSDSNLLRRQSYIDSVIHELEGSHVIEGGLIGYAEQFSDLQAGNIEGIGRSDDEDSKLDDKVKTEESAAIFVENDGKIEENSKIVEKNQENLNNIEENQQNLDQKQETAEENIENSIKSIDKINELPLNPTTTLKKSSIFPTISSSSHQKIIPVAKVQPENIKALTSKSQQKLEPEASQLKQASVPHPAKQAKNSMMRQKTMPVQIESSVMRVLPKHLRKRIQSAEGEKKKKRPVLMQ